jgi:hypothetical protein
MAEPTYTMGALGRRVYDRVNDVTNRAIGLQSPAMCAVEAYIDKRPHPPEWRSAADDCWKMVEDGLRAIIVDAARALAEVEMARRQVPIAPG